MRIAILAVQGAFAEHRAKLESLGAGCVEIRKKGDLNGEFDGLVLPGGESTVQGKLLRELELFQPIKEKIEDGIPVMGTCAGLILLAEKISNEGSPCFGTLPVTVKRNAYGRQLGSFHTEADFKGAGTVPMTFIRAPYIEKAGEGAEVLAEVEGHIVAVRFGRQFGLAFHPELEADNRIHEMFLAECMVVAGNGVKESKKSDFFK